MISFFDKVALSGLRRKDQPSSVTYWIVFPKRRGVPWAFQGKNQMISENQVYLLLCAMFFKYGKQNHPLKWTVFLPDICFLRRLCSFTFLNMKSLCEQTVAKLAETATEKKVLKTLISWIFFEKRMFFDRKLEFFSKENWTWQLCCKLCISRYEFWKLSFLHEIWKLLAINQKI